MAEKTFTKGKERDLESTVEMLQRMLNSWGIDVEVDSHLNPLPNVHALQLRDKACSVMVANGNGSSEKAALASALGNFFTRLSSDDFFADYYLGGAIAAGAFVHSPDEQWFTDEEDEMPEGLLNEALWDDVYDPEADLEPEELIDVNSGADDERGICALPFERLSDGETVYFPVNIIQNLYAGNGTASGSSANEARVLALSEICENYTKKKVIAEGISLPEIPAAVIARFPDIEASVAALKAEGFNLRIADASLGGRYPVLSAALIRPETGGVLVSFGAHPCFETALERAVMKVLQGHSLKQIGDSQVPTFDMKAVAESPNLVGHLTGGTGLISYDFFKQEPDHGFVDWNHDVDAQGQFDLLSKAIDESGFEIYSAQQRYQDIHTCRVIVPGMSEIYPVEDLAWNNNNEGVEYREQLLSLDKLGPEGWQSVLEDLEDGGLSDTRNVAELIGVAADEGTEWALLQVGTLKGMLALALEAYEKAMEWVDWSLCVGQISPMQRQHFQCIKALLTIVLDDEKSFASYRDSLQLLYGAETLQRCVDLVQSKTQFLGLHFPGLSLEGFETHQALLEGYKKLHRAKQESWSQHG